MTTPLRNARVPRNGYGNIYTPHAGSMIIQVQRETGLANRTLVLSERQVRLLRALSSRWTIALAGILAATFLVLAVQSARVPLLEREVSRLREDNGRVSTLERRLTDLQSRYEQIRAIMSGTAAGTIPAGSLPAGGAATRPAAGTPPGASPAQQAPTAPATATAP